MTRIAGAGLAARQRARRGGGDGTAPASSGTGADVPARHPLEESGRLAWQATAAVGLLERFGDLLTVALDAVGAGDDAALDAALAERERLVAQLEPLLAALAEARESTGRWTPAAGTPAISADTPASQAAIALILRPVNEALRHAQHLHLRLADEVRGREGRGKGSPSPIALVR